MDMHTEDQVEQMSVLSFEGRTPENKNAYHPQFRAAIQERHKVSAADPSAPPDTPKPNWHR